MALFSDGPVSTVEDLTAHDSQLLDVAGTEGIDVTRKLALAQDDIGVELAVLLNKLSFVDQPFWTAPVMTMGNVVVTPPLKLWHTYLTLEMVYRDAYNNQLNDRYAGKRDQFHQMAEWAAEKLIQSGVGMTARPVAQAATPQVTAIAGALPDGTYYVSASWLNSLGEEGASATPASITIAASALQVEAGVPPENATNWNVYMGREAGTMVLQNQAPIGAGVAWQQTAALVTAGRAPGEGQAPALLKPVPRVIQRG